MSPRPSRILIVDDEPAHVEAIRRALLNADAAAEIRVADSLLQYQEAVAARPPDLALLDYLLPDGKASAVLTSPSEVGPFPIVVMTSHGDQRVAVDAMKQGALDYVVKSPEAFEEMPRTVERALRAWRMLMDRRRALEALKASEARFSKIFRTSPAAIGISRVEDGRFLDVNDAFVSLYGYPREEVVGRTADELGLWQTPPRARMVEELREKKGVRNLAMQGRRKDGATLDLLVSVEVMELNGEPCIVGTLTDLTALRKTEAALRQSERLQGTILQNIPDPAWMKDLEGRFLAANKAWSELVGIPAEAAVGRRDSDLFSPAVGERFREQERGVAASGRGQRWEETFPDFQGEEHVFETFKAPVMDAEGGVIATIGIARDITARKTGERLNRIQHSLASELAATGNLDEALQVCLARAIEAAQVDSGGFHLFDERTGCLLLKAHRGLSKEFVASVSRFAADSLQAALPRAGKAVYASFTKGDLPQAEAERKEGLRAMAMLPLLHEGRGIGCLNVASHSAEEIAPALRTGLEIIAASTAQAIVRLQAEAALREGEKRLRMALQAAQMGTFDADLLEGRVTWSARHEALWGLQRGEFAGTYEAFLRQVHPDDRVGIQAAWDRSVSARVPFRHEYRVVWPDGSLHWVESAGEFVFDPVGLPVRLHGTVLETTSRRQSERFHALSSAILTLLNETPPDANTTQQILEIIQRETGFDAVGIRLWDGRDYPYQGSLGFSAEFLETEGRLVSRNADGGLCRDEHGNLRLECTCGMILSGKVDPNHPQVTPAGSLWTNDARSFLPLPSGQDPRLNPRNRCIHQGFQSIALIPVRVQQKVIGLLQLNDRRKGCFTREAIRFLEGIAASFGLALLRRQEELELRRSEADLREAQRVAKVGNWSFDPNTGEVRWSEELFRIFGLQPSEFGRTYQAFVNCVHPEDRPRVLQVNQQALAGHSSFEVEYRVVTPSGGVKTVREIGNSRTDRGGKVIGLFGTAQDITEQKRAEAALVAGEERFRTLVDSAPIGIYAQVAGKFAYLNQAARRMFGGGELVGHAVLDCFHPEDHARVREFTHRLNTERQPVLLAEHKCLRLDGTTFEAEFTRVPFVFDGQAGALVFFQDVTERRRLESELRQAQKLEAIGQLAGGVAHDFNNILAAIMMHLGLFRINPALDEDTRHALKDLEAEARRAASLTRQLLMFSRRSVLAVKPIDLNEVVTNLLKMLRRLIGEQNDVRFHDKANLPWVSADTGMMEQVLMNLVVNARDAMPKGGCITITTSVAELGEQEAALNPARRRGCFVCLAVSDTGTGMDEATLKHIFEPFFTTKEVGKGTGLGLATVHGIVAQHQGWVEIESKVGCGSTFRVFLPALPQAAGQAGADAPAEPLQHGGETILLVEDDAKARQLIGQVLRVLGYRVHEAANGQQAMILWQTQGPQIDLLLTDMVMPEGITGLELVELLRASKPGLKTIISSGYSAEIAQAGVPTKAGIMYLPKPYEVQTLAEIVRKCLDQKL